MSLKKTNDKRGSYRGAGAYSRDYANFDDLDRLNYPARDIYAKIDGVGDYETDRAFTGAIDGTGDSNRWKPLADRQNTRGDGAYSKEGRRSTERPRKQSDGRPSGGQKVGENTDW